MAQSQNQWFVQVGGQSYGPYSLEQMQGFMAEGRVIASSLVSQDAVQGFAMAAAFPAFGQLLAPASAQPASQPPAAQPAAPAPALQPAPTQPAPTQTSPIPAAPERGALTVFVIMAEIRSDNAMQFLQALQAYGTAQRIGDTVWLLRSDVTINSLHSILSQNLTRQDRLFILDSFANKTAWSHIGADMDQRIRDMWAV